MLESYLALEEDISLDMLYIVENYGLIYSQIATSLEAVESELSLVSGIIEKLNLEIQQAEEHLTRLQEDFQIQLIGYLKHA